MFRRGVVRGGGVWARVPAKAKWTGNAVFAVAWGTCRGIPGVCNPLEASVWDGEASVGRAGDDPRGAGGVARPVAGQGSGGLVETVGVWPSPASANGGDRGLGGGSGRRRAGDDQGRRALS